MLADLLKIAVNEIYWILAITGIPPIGGDVGIVVRRRLFGTIQFA